MTGFLLDEHISKAVRRELLRRAPDLVVVCIGDPGAPAKETSDPDLLFWCEDRGLALVSKDIRTLPKHFADHLAAVHESAGVLLAPSDWSVGEFVTELLVVALASLDDEYVDALRYLPIT